ncbi:Two-component sensor histidine kinase, contains HisKA and HATPase domains [Tistlia consotensis]|uniref:histidine kinase n=1 Tax=Tistlia consotensis USBA 355 TaxID=560819 RepID=A0A1Y6CDP8_9PROT|nr:PAS domain-containing sensor histidine kinase [Tistlia consotensis]SMF57499.1 Two-component sensor histidine kinase, contains HisKA and HATPase domains [Tistlia consotensis USBA 355]SNR45806.1 Two-component sensor histidine kinase, contains HisKA and HATPase domains [Tistlia consotensis]
MDSLLQYLFGAAAFMPHGSCLLWRPDLVALHAGSDALIALAYLAIPLAILSFLKRREGLRPVERRIAYLFALFIFLCALTHLSEVVTLWFPAYVAQGLLKAATAIVSLYTAMTVWSLVPSFLSLLSPAELQQVNEELKSEIAAHRETTEKLRKAETELNRTLDARTRELRETSQRFDLTLRGSGITVFQQDRDLTYTWMYNPPAPLTDEAFIGRSDREMMLPEATLASVEPAKRAVLESGETTVVEVPFPSAEGDRWFKLFIEPLHEAEAITGIACVAIDITEEKAVENQLRIVLRELTHRTKNILMIVQAIARQTARNIESPAEFIKRFSARLSALAGAHDILVNRAWAGASLEELIDDQLAYLPEGPREAVSIEGPAIELGANQAQNLALAIHELSTNATKFGALSSEGGTVGIRWRLEGEPDAPTLLLVWQESGGPPVVEPEASGFGRLMLEKLVPDAISGRAELDFAPQGLRWQVRFPLGG